MLIIYHIKEHKILSRLFYLFIYLFIFYIFSIFFIADLIEQRIYWTDYYFGFIKSAKLDGSDVQLITSDVNGPMGIAVHYNDIYFSERWGGLYKQSKSPGSSKIHIHSDPYMWGIKEYQNYTRTYNVIKLGINTISIHLSNKSFTYSLLSNLNTVTHHCRI